jgi:hypothetical protein
MIKFIDAWGYSISINLNTPDPKLMDGENHGTLINIKVESVDHRDVESVDLTPDLAIQFSKELRRAIAKAKEVSNV